MESLQQPFVAFPDGTRMPQLGFGVWRVSDQDARKVVRTAIEVGYRAIDTARLYQNEEGVGQAIEDCGVPRDQLFITTKVWNEDHGFDATLRAFDASLRRLRLDFLDLFLIHWPAPRRNQYVDTWRALLRLKEEGRTRAIGVSNFQPAHLERIIAETGVAPVINQIELHPQFQQRALRRAHEQLSIVTQAWSPLGQGQSLKDRTIGAIATKHQRTPAQVVLRWHLQQGIVAIPKSVTPQRIRENFDVFGFSLDDDDLAKIANLDQAKGRIGPDPDTAEF